MNTIQCNYASLGKTRRGRLYECSKCGHRRVSRKSPELLHRPCSVAVPRLSVRETLEQTLRTKIDRGETCRTWEEVQETLDKCFGDCKQFDGRVCQAGVVSPCKRFEVWITTLLIGPCGRYVPRKEQKEQG